MSKRHHVKCWAGWSTSWNQDYWEKYQPQVCRWHHPYGRKQRGTKEPLDESQRVKWKNWLKTQHSENEDHGIRSHHFMANRLWNNGNSDRLYFFWRGDKITADGDCSHEIKRCLLLGRKAMTNLDSILKSRYYFAYKGLPSQSYGFSSSRVWIWELDHKEGWAPRIDAFELWCWRDSWEFIGLQGDPTSPS